MTVLWIILGIIVGIVCSLILFLWWLRVMFDPLFDRLCGGRG